MGKLYNFPQTLEKMLQQIKSEKGLWEFQPGKFAILHKEVERLAYEFGIETDVETKYADLPKGCAIVKATAVYQGKKFTSLGEVSPANNNFIFPISICENSSHQANLEQLQRENKEYLLELTKKNSTKAKDIMKAFENKKQQLIGGK